MGKLPKKVKICLSDLFEEYKWEEVLDKINDYLSDTYGYCVEGYSYDSAITVQDIEWDEGE